MNKKLMDKRGECTSSRKLGAFMDYMGLSRLGLLFDLIPNIGWYLNDPDCIPERFRDVIDKVFEMWNVKEITQDIDVNMSLLAAYQLNAEERWKKNVGQLSLGEVPNKNTHKGIDHQAYLEMLNARHIAAIPWMTGPFSIGHVYHSAVDLGGGAGTLMKILKDAGTVKETHIVDRPDMIDNFQRSRFSGNADHTHIGDITSYDTWEDMFKVVKAPSLWIISDVLHGRSISDRGKIYNNISTMLSVGFAIKEKYKYTIPDIYIREFLGFSETDSLLFDLQLRLFTQGQLLTFDELRAELKKSKLEYQYDFNNGLYYYGQVVREEMVEHCGK